MHRRFPKGNGQAYKDGNSTAWRYVMLSREQSRAILRRIVSGERSGNTLAVWVAAQSYAEWNTGRIVASVPQLGGLVRTGRGRYAINPEVAWAGTLGQREARLESVE